MKEIPTGNENEGNWKGKNLWTSKLKESYAGNFISKVLIIITEVQREENYLNVREKKTNKHEIENLIFSFALFENIFISSKVYRVFKSQRKWGYNDHPSRGFKILRLR